MKGFFFQLTYLWVTISVPNVFSVIPEDHVRNPRILEFSRVRGFFYGYQALESGTWFCIFNRLEWGVYRYPRASGAKTKPPPFSSQSASHQYPSSAAF